MKNQDIYLDHFEFRKNQILFLGQSVYLDFGLAIDTSNPLHKKILYDEGVIIQRRSIERDSLSQERFLVVEPHPYDFALYCSGFIIDQLSRGA